MVVASRMSNLRAMKSIMAFSRSCSPICPWPTTIFASGTRRASSAPIEKIDSTRLCTKYTWPPRASSLRTARVITAWSNFTTLVWIARRSFGGVSMIDMSRMPTSDMFSVRGIGVAVIVSTSTFLRSCLIFSLCATPKRCSSSTTSSPRSRNTTSFDSRRCVPTMMSTLPSARSASDCFCSCFVRKRLSMSMRTGKPAKRSPQRLHVLEREHGGGREERHLLAVHHGLERGAHRHFGLAVAHVAAQQAVHGRRRLHVALDVLDGRLSGRR